MTLKCLIIGKGESQGFERVRGDHQLEFRWSAREKGDVGSPIIDIRNSYNYVFMHTRNEEADTAIKAFLEQGYTGKVVGISAGSIQPEFLEIGIAEMTGVRDKETVLGWNWERVPDDFDGTAAELVKLLEARQRTYTAALFILCQGYIAVHAERREGGWDPAEMKAILREMGWNDDVAKTCAESFKSKQALALVQNGAGWWQPVFAPLKKDELLSKISEELGTQNVKSSISQQIATLVEEIYGANGAVKLSTVAKAYRCLAGELT